jgi:hypothetical protein
MSTIITGYSGWIAVIVTFLLKHYTNVTEYTQRVRGGSYCVEKFLRIFSELDLLSMREFRGICGYSRHRYCIMCMLGLQ